MTGLHGGGVYHRDIRLGTVLLQAPSWSMTYGPEDVCCFVGYEVASGVSTRVCEEVLLILVRLCVLPLSRVIEFPRSKVGPSVSWRPFSAEGSTPRIPLRFIL